MSHSFIRTVLGDIAPRDLGICYAHEHIIIDASYPTGNEADFQLDSVELAARELKVLYADGGRAVVDSMPCDCGRNILKLAAVSRESSVHIVAPTGIHLAKYYDAGHWSHFYSVEELTQLFVADINEGIDAHDYNGPLIQRTEHRAGVIKVASPAQWDERTERIFHAAAAAQQATGAPILTHTEEGTLALEQVETLQRYGADLSHVVLSHLDRNPDIECHRAVLKTGVNLEYDSAFRWNKKSAKSAIPGETTITPAAETINHTLRLLTELVPEFPRQIMLGMDAARRSYWKSYGGSPGMSFLLTEFQPQLLAAGLTSAHLQNIFIHNPARTYAFITS